MVQAQLVERSLPTLEVRNSNPVIGKIEFSLCKSELPSADVSCLVESDFKQHE